MSRLLWVFVGWTLFSWATRLRNIVGDDTLVGGDRTFAIVVTVVFVLGALAIPAIAKFLPRGLGSFAWAASVVTALWWAMRMVTNLAGDGSVPFKAVHTVLAVVSIGLAVAVIRSVNLNRMFNVSAD